MAKFSQKIVHFIKYHNAFTLIVVFVVFLSGISLANEKIREEVFLGKKEKIVGIDNSLLLATNFDNWEFEPEILSIEEDEENYYVQYRFKTLDVVNNVWQETFKENLLKFQKVVLGNRDLADYITEEIGEVILHEYQLLKDSQKIAQKEGKTQRVKVTEYSGLVGKILDLKPKIEPIEQPQLAIENIPQETPPICQECEEESELENPKTSEETLRQIVEKVLAEKGILPPASPQPEISPTPTPPEISPTPTPEISPTPTPETSLTPEVSPTPEASPTISPEPSSSETPTPEITPPSE